MKSFYNWAKEGFMDGDLQPRFMGMRLLLVTADYVFDPTDRYESDLLATAIASRSQAMANQTITGGIFKSDPVTFLAVPANNPIVGIIGIIDNGTAASNDVVWFQDEGVAGLPFTPNGNDVILTPGPNGYWKVP